LTPTCNRYSLMLWTRRHFIYGKTISLSYKSHKNTSWNGYYSMHAMKINAI